MIEERFDESAGALRVGCPVLVTERLVLRPPHDDDLEELVALANNARIAMMLARMPHPYGEAEARAFLASVRDDKAGDCAYAITLADSGRFAGGAGLERKGKTLELGYWIGETYWGRGFATEAAHALVDLAFRATDIDVLEVSCRVINSASRRVIHKCGFQYAGQGMMDSVAAGKVAVERYRLDRGTWASLRSWGRI